MIIIVGASSGLGKEVAGGLLNFQNTLLTHYSNQINLPNENIKSQFLDLTNTNSIDKFVSENKKVLKDITVVNLSTFSKDGLFINYNEKDWKKTFDININGPVYLIKKLLPIMISNKFGRIINVSSYLANTGEIGASAYSSSKSALIGLTKSIAKEYARFNILSNIIELGYFNVGLIENLDQKKLKEIKNKIPTRSLGKSIEIINMIKLLIKSNYINGSQIKINGGL